MWSFGIHNFESSNGLKWFSKKFWASSNLTSEHHDLLWESKFIGGKQIHMTVQDGSTLAPACFSSITGSTDNISTNQQFSSLLQSICDFSMWSLYFCNKCYYAQSWFQQGLYWVMGRQPWENPTEGPFTTYNHLTTMQCHDLGFDLSYELGTNLDS